jgi:hypothetical protein
MPALSIQPPYPIFTDTDGQPLENGYVWIGTANQNPITNPITAYWDAALTVTAAQPVRTLNGYPSNAGTPARLYVNSDYSIQVQNKNGTVVYSALGATERLSDVVVTGVDSSEVTFLQAGTNAVTRTAQAKMRDVVSVLDFGADPTGVADSTAAIQSAINSLPNGGTVYFPRGSYLSNATINIPQNGICLLLDQAASIVYNTISNTTYTCLNVTGDYCSIEGGMGGGFIGPSLWSGSNVTPTFAVILISGDFCKVKTRLFNIYKWGVWFKDCVGGTVEESQIIGNYPSASWTGVETGHVGVMFDPSTDNRGGSFVLSNSIIESCVQGCLPANFGAGTVLRGLSITGNVFYGCWNHGVYSNYTNGAQISSNNFNRCQIPVVISGDGNVVSSNTMYTATGTVGDERDICGISVRDGSRNVVSNNAIKGVLNSSSTTCINIQDVNGTAELNDNIVIGNTIEITDGGGASVLAIRVFGNTNAANRNIVSNNTIFTPGGGAATGAISLIGKSGSQNSGNKVLDNNITVTSQGEAIFVNNCVSATIKGNHHNVRWNAGSALNVYTVWLADCSRSTMERNETYVDPAYGSNVTCYGYRESGTNSDHSVTQMVNSVNTGGGASFLPFLVSVDSGLLVNQTGTGAPSVRSKIGSIWTRTDGGAVTTLYVKESGTGSAGWVGK